MQLTLEKEKKRLVLADKPFARGGEAAIFALTDRTDLVAKVYHKATAKHAAKLAAMIANPPTDPMAGKGHASIAWPRDRVLDGSGKVVGYVMPRVENARPVIELYNPRSRLQQCPLFHYVYLLRTARNLTAAVRAVHERGYVIGDLNESNILARFDTLVTLVDTDSFQVPDGKEIHRCLVGKPEYTPPELQGKRFADFDRAREHDAFGLAVLIYQLLMQGTHPFDGRFTGKGEPGSTGEKISSGYWPHHSQRKVPYQPMPIAPPFVTLPPPVQELMRRCFESGHDDPRERPNAGAWQKALDQAEKALVECKDNAEHRYHKELSSCPWCTMAKGHGRDPFPSKQAVQSGRIGIQRSLPPPPPPPSPSSTSSGSGASSIILRPKPSKPKVPSFGPTKKTTPTQPAKVWVGVGLCAVACIAICGGLVAMFNGSDDSNKNRPVQPPVVNQQAPIVQKSSAEPPPEIVKGEIRRFDGVQAEVHTVAFSPKGDLVIAGAGSMPGGRSGKESTDCRVRVWNVDNGGIKSALPDNSASGAQGSGFADPILALAVHDRHVLFADHRTLVYWNVDEGKEVRRFSVLGEDNQAGGAPAGGNAPGFPAQFQDFFPGGGSPPGPGGAVAAPAPPPQLPEPRILSVAISADGERALSSFGPIVVQWDLRDGKERLPRLTGHMAEVRQVAFDPNRRSRALTASADRTVRLWDLDQGRELCLVGHTDAVNSVAFSADGHFALSGGADRTMRLWNLEDGRELRRWGGHGAAITSVRFCPGDRQAVSSANDATIRFWNLDDGKEVHQLSLAGNATALKRRSVHSLAFSPDGSKLLTGGADKTVRLWTAPDFKALAGKVPAELPKAVDAAPPPLWTSVGSPVIRVAFAKRGLEPSGPGELISISRDGRVRVWDLTTRWQQTAIQIPASAVDAAEIAQDGGRVFLSFPDKVAIGKGVAPGFECAVWEVRNGSKRSLDADVGMVTASSLAPHGQFVLTGGSDGMLRLWNRTDGKQISVLPLPHKQTPSRPFGPGGGGSPPNGPGGRPGGEPPPGPMGGGPPGGGGAPPSGAGGKGAGGGPPGGGGGQPGLEAGEQITALALAPVGRRALVCSDNDVILVTMEKTNNELKERALRYFEGHKALVTCVAFHPKGRLALTGSVDRTVRLWDVESGEQLQRWEGLSETVNCVAISPDGRCVLAGNGAGVVQLWSLATGKEIQRFEAHAKPVLSVAFSADGSMAASGSLDGSLRAWPLPALGPDEPMEPPLPGQPADFVGEIVEFNRLPGEVQTIAISPDGKRALSGSSALAGKEAGLYLWDLEQRAPLRRFAGHLGTITSVCFSPDGAWALSAGEDKTVRLWDVEAGRQQRFLGGEAVPGQGGGGVPGLGSPGGASPGGPGGGGGKEQFAPHAAALRSVAFSRDGQYAISGGDDGSVHLYEINSGKIVTSDAANFRVSSVDFSPDGRFLLAGSTPDIILSDGKKVTKVTGHKGAVLRALFSADGKQIVSCSADNTIRVWSVADVKAPPKVTNVIPPLKKMESKITTVALSPDGRRVLFGAEQGTLHLWDLKGEKGSQERQVFTGHRGPVRSVAFSPDGRHALSGGADKTMRWWGLPK